MALPPQHPLAGWGTGQLRVWADEERLWVLAQGKFPALPAGPRLRPARLLPGTGTVLAMAAVLWHDLRVAGEAVFPAARPGPRPQAEGKDRKGVGGAARGMPAGGYLSLQDHYNETARPFHWNFIRHDLQKRLRAIAA